jgi:UPF0716 protein FxsA
MVGFLFILLLAVPIVEIALFIEIGGLIGVWPTIGIVIATAIAGAALLRSQGLATLKSARASLAENRFPIDEVFDGLCLAVAGALLLTPGFFTDAVGLLLFVPPVRAVLRRRLAAYVAARAEVEIHAAKASADWQAGPVIDGEYRDVSPDRKPPNNPPVNNAGRDSLPKPPPGRAG